MNRRSFAQSVGSVVALSALARSSWRESSPDSTPGRIMAIAAHPGDGLFTIGAVLAQQIQGGGSGTLLRLWRGEKGSSKRYPYSAIRPEIQRIATQKATHLLGADAIFLAYPDAEIPFNEESTLAVSDAIRQYKPEVVITHWSGSWNKDHQNCHSIVQDAVFYSALETMPRSRPAHSVSKGVTPRTGRMLTTLQPTRTWISKQSTRSGFRRVISILCGEGRRAFFDTTITTALFR